MCGITAIINRKNEAIPSGLLESATEVIAHRGPDGFGYFYGDNFAFGHRRLAIIDLTDDGIQPMHRHRQVITFNGEIFNYIELREELILLGYHFETATDTEVILQAYNEWGMECQNHFIGMWAFVLYDASKDILFCSRDRFSQKPLLYTILDDYLFIGSEIKQFMVHPSFVSTLNKKSAFDFLENTLLNHNENTFFEGVYSILGGHQLVYSLSKHTFQVTKWYHPNLTEIKESTFEKSKNTLLALVRDSIKLRLRSDVTVGVALSGGLDSSGITCIAHNIDAKGKYKAITSCYEDAKYDERHYAELVADQTHFELYKTFPQEDELITEQVLEKMTYYHEQPIPSGSHFSEYSIFKTAHQQNIIVMLCGQGPDEHCGGYDSFFSIYYLSLLKKLRFIELYQALKARKGGGIQNLKSFLGFLFFNARHKRPCPFINYKVLGYTSRKPTYGILNKTDSIRKLSIEQIFDTSIPYQAHSEDRSSMCFSIESRAPYLDHRLVEYAVRLPDSYKIKGRKTKYILREALHGIIPEEVYARKDKMGFVAPDEVWMRTSSALIRPQLEQSIDQLKGIIFPSLLDHYDLYLEGKATYTPLFFKVWSLGALCKVYKMEIAV